MVIGRWHVDIFPFGWFLIGLFALLVLVLIGWLSVRMFSKLTHYLTAGSG